MCFYFHVRCYTCRTWGAWCTRDLQPPQLLWESGWTQAAGFAINSSGSRVAVTPSVYRSLAIQCYLVLSSPREEGAVIIAPFHARGLNRSSDLPTILYTTTFDFKLSWKGFAEYLLRADAFSRCIWG